MSDNTTKVVDVQSCIICERADDKYMVMTLSTKVGQFDFTFSPDRWQRLGESAGWFAARSVELEVDLVETNGTKEIAR